jgi:hypothetical protein
VRILNVKGSFVGGCQWEGEGKVVVITTAKLELVLGLRIMMKEWGN